MIKMFSKAVVPLKVCTVSAAPTDGGETKATQPEVYYVRRGAGYITANGEKLELSAGEVAAMDFNVNRTPFIPVNGNTECIYFSVENMRVSGNSTLGLLAASAKPYLKFRLGDDLSVFDSLTSALKAEMTSDKELSDLMAPRIAELLLGYVLRHIEHPPTSGRKHAIALKAYLDGQSSEVSLKDARSALGISEYGLSKRFCAETGVTPVRYLMQKKVEKAKQLLESSDDDINDIALACGFSSPAYFCRVFKHLTGRTALSYRAAYKAANKISAGKNGRKAPAGV